MAADRDPDLFPSRVRGALAAAPGPYTRHCVRSSSCRGVGARVGGIFEVLENGI